MIEDVVLEQVQVWESERKYSQEKRARNRRRSSEILQEKGWRFETRNEGAHLIVEGRWDFWPGTGLFIDRKTKARKRGVFNLMKVLKRELGERK